MQEYVAFYEAHPVGFVTIIALFGLLVGSFLNVVALRLPVMLERTWKRECREWLGGGEAAPREEERFNLIVPRSHCPSCGHKITALENIPVISWLVLRGKCHACGMRISFQYPAVELAAAVLAMVVAWHFGVTWQTLAALGLTWTLLALSVIDIRTQLLPDVITLPLLWAGIILNFGGLFTNLESAVLGAIMGYMALWTVYQLFRLLTGKEGMGFGDFKLLAALGAWLGWEYLPLIILLSAVVGAVVGLSLIALRGRDRNIPIPFGPYLAGGGWIALLWGEEIMRAYLGPTAF
ncbi:MAG TPA: prepilin peptidase [Thioalkalivibrio sp.]|nr:prepilin peptidase [Thioalkalivibrio sp.]